MGVLVGKPAPDFTCGAVLGNGEIKDNFKLSEAIKGKYGLVFFYPLDFTFVCPSELIALDNRVDAFKALAEPAPKPLRERIGEQNLLTVSRLGPAVVEAVLADIARQREQAHEALLARHGRRGPRRA